ncbi:MAG: hypothetical protein QNJ31_03845 [Candidatus Caenarcaniphilales bacterium]|nr:hypothetical protein [Candidatus Caenarcaniphilales bacterium]
MNLFPPSAEVKSSLPNNNLSSLLYNAGAKDAKGIFDIADASGAIKANTEVQKQKAFEVIKEAIKTYKKNNPNYEINNSRDSLYSFVELSLGKNGLLTYPVQIPEQSTNESIDPNSKDSNNSVSPSTKPTQNPFRYASSAKSFTDKFYAALRGVSLDSYQIYAALKKAKLINSKAGNERKKVISLIKSVIQPEQAQLKDQLSGSSIQTILLELRSSGYVLEN